MNQTRQASLPVASFVTALAPPLASDACSLQTWVGTVLGILIVVLVLYIGFKKMEITWNLISMALVGVAFLGMSVFSHMHFGPGGIDFERAIRDLEKQIETLTQRLEKSG